MTTRLPETEKMIAKVCKKKDLSEKDAIEYMLNVATGRLAALWRYDISIPEGKENKGVLALAGRKKRADRAKPIMALSAVKSASEKTAAKVAKPRKAKPRKAKPEQQAIEVVQ